MFDSVGGDRTVRKLTFETAFFGAMMGGKDRNGSVISMHI
jgi:hypothetical protein